MILNKPYVLSGIRKLTPTVSSFTFKAQDSAVLDFIPGMFAMLRYSNPETGESIARAFSIANPPPSDSLEFIIALIHGRFTVRLDTAKPGDLFSVSAPYGQFKFDMKSDSRFLFLAGGTGIAPFMSMLRYAKQEGSAIDTTMIYSTKYANELICKDELDQYCRKPGFRMAITVTRPQQGDGWNGITGHVDAEMISKNVPDFRERISYICGPPAFVKAVNGALTGLGVDRKQIKAEMWG